MSNLVVKSLLLREICLDQKAQPRVRLNQEVIEEYAEDIGSGVIFPPVRAFHDGERYWLADGFHRYHAHEKAGVERIRAEVLEGELRDAILCSVGANAAHGLRRSNDDKRRAVRTVLEDEEWQKWSENQVATRCGVSRTLVASVKKELEARGSHLAEKQDGTVTFTRGGKSHAMKVEKIGRKPEKPSPRDPTDISEPVPAAHYPDADALRSLRTICASFSVLPTPKDMVNLIKEHHIDFAGSQADEMAAWFQAFASLLDDASGYIRPSGRRAFPSYHSVVEEMEE
jgi:hypothetical protein